MRSYLTGSFLIAHMKVRYSPNHYLLLVIVISQCEYDILVITQVQGGAEDEC